MEWELRDESDTITRCAGVLACHCQTNFIIVSCWLFYLWCINMYVTRIIKINLFYSKVTLVLSNISRNTHATNHHTATITTQQSSTSGEQQTFNILEHCLVDHCKCLVCEWYLFINCTTVLYPKQVYYLISLSLDYRGLTLFTSPCTVLYNLNNNQIVKCTIWKATMMTVVRKQTNAYYKTSPLLF